jgi:hypothetical protein
VCVYECGWVGVDEVCVERGMWLMDMCMCVWVCVGVEGWRLGEEGREGGRRKSTIQDGQTFSSLLVCVSVCLCVCVAVCVSFVNEGSSKQGSGKE